MWKLAIFCGCLTLVCAAPPPVRSTSPRGPPPTYSPHVQPHHDHKTAHIVNQESSVDADGKYHYSFETSDGTKAEQNGALKQIGNELGETSNGYYEYTDQGVVYRVDYTADENGFVATGPHIPKIPEIIARALKWAKEHPYKEPEQRKH